jgi:HK97 family phage major capsid protein/HK97 family phage prohead protease
MPYKTTDGMKADAQRGLDWRSEFGRGGTEIGIARARDIVNDRNLSEDTVQRMFSFFSRHEVDKQAEGFRQGEKGYPSNGRIAWALWGGDAGFTWSKNIMDSLNEERTMQDIDNSDTITENVRNDAMENEEVNAEEVEAVAAETEIVAEETERFSRDTMSTRAMGAEDAVINADTRRVKIAVSSEAPVERSFGTEILDHKASSIDLSFLNSGRAPLLLDHDPTQQIGVVESVDLDGSARRLRATVRFGKNGLAKDVFDDVADGIRANISVGYQINKLDKEGREVYRATSWTPMEVSVVSIPADRTVGVGRSAVDNLDTQPTSIQITKEFPMEHQVDMEAVKAEAARSAAKDTAEIFRLASKHNKREMAEKAVSEGKSLAQFRGELLEVIGNAPLEAQDLGLTKKEVRNFSLMRAIRAMANPTDRNAQRDAAFEFEASAAAQAVYGREARGLMIPTDVLRQWAKRDINTSDDGGLVAEDFRGGDFVDVLRNASSVMAAGATMLTGLSGNVAIPKKSAASAGGWISSEGGASSESEPTFGQITMTPRTVGAFTDITRLMMMQSSLDIENLIRNDLSTALALAIDLGALAGSGSSGQPTGIKNTSGINAPTAFAGAVPTFAEVVAMETAVAEDNALLGNLAYILPASMYGALKTTTKDSGSGQFVVAPDGSMNGYNAIVSNQVTSGDLYFGNFADCLIGMYGGLDITVDPYTASSSGTVRIVALQTADVAVRHAVSFAFNNDE